MKLTKQNAKISIVLKMNGYVMALTTVGTKVMRSNVVLLLIIDKHYFYTETSNYMIFEVELIAFSLPFNSIFKKMRFTIDCGKGVLKGQNVAMENDVKMTFLV